MKIIKRDYPIVLIAVLLCVFPLFVREYSTDSYTIECVGLESFGNSVRSDGRLITAAGFYVFDLLGGHSDYFYYASFLASILFMSLAVYHFYWVLKGHMRRKTAFFLAFFTIFNPLMIEYYLFIEGFFIFALCMSVLALKNFVRFLRGERKRIVLSYFYLILSALTYQSLPGIFVALAVVFIALYSKNFKQFLINNVVAMSVYGVGTGSCFLYLKCNPGSSRMGEGLCFSNLAKCFLPLGWLTLLIYLVAFSALFLVCYEITLRRGEKKTTLSFLKCVYILLGAAFVTFFPFLFTTPAALWLPFRVLAPLGTAAGGLAIFFCYRFEVLEESSEKHFKSSSVMAAILAIELIFFQTIVIGRLLNNATDERLCKEIGGFIQEYEEETGNEIKKVCIYYDAKLTKRNPGVLKIGDSNVRAFSKTWSDVAHMNVILQRDFEKCEPNVELTAFFAQQNWDSFDEEQLIFEGETLHLCVY